MLEEKLVAPVTALEVVKGPSLAYSPSGPPCGVLQPSRLESGGGSQCWLITPTLHHLEMFPLSRAKSKANYCIKADVSLGARVHKL